MKTSSTFTFFFTVLFEHLFLFLLGVFVGGGCTLFYAVYIVDQTVRSCGEKEFPNGSSPFLSAEVDHQTSCYTAFTTFIAVLGFVALLYALFKSYRYYHHHRQNCPKAELAKITTTSEGETEKGGGNLGDTEAVSAIKMTSTSPSEGGNNNNNPFLLTPRQASALLPSSLEHSKSTTSIRTDPSLKGATTPPDHLK